MSLPDSYFEAVSAKRREESLRAEYVKVERRLSEIFGTLNAPGYVPPSDALLERKWELERLLGISERSGS